jgi:hypothetical protein
MYPMRGKAILVLLGITAFGAYSVGRQSAPVNYVPVSAPSVPSPTVAKPVAFTSPAAPVATSGPPPSSSNTPNASAKASLPDKPASAGPDSKPTGAETKRKVEGALTAAAIAAIIVQASRDQYHAGGRPCACPDDSARNGSACGGRSAYSRPGGAAPLCYPSNVTAAMIESYRQRQASR